MLTAEQQAVAIVEAPRVQHIVVDRSVGGVVAVGQQGPQGPAGGGGGGGADLSDDIPEPLGAAAAGISTEASRSDHVHVMPSAADVGASPTGHTHNYVESVSATAPVTSTGGQTPTIAMPAATASANGYMTSTQASKLDGIETGADVTDATNVAAAGAEMTANKATTFGTVNDTLYPSVKAVKDYADALVVGLLDDRGTYDASGNVFPSTGGSGTAGAILKGDLWFVSVAGTLGGVAVAIGDQLRALTDAPGQTASNWAVMEGNVGYVPENVTNKVTSISGSSTDTEYPSAKLLYDQLMTNASNDRARANHTGTQTASTISDFNSAALAAAPAETTTTVGALINGATEKTTPVDADMVGLMDSAASNVLKKLSWANIKTTLKTWIEATGFTFSQPQVISANSASDALRITQTGAGNALVVEDEANPDSTPFVIDASGRVIIGKTSAYDAAASLQLYATTAYNPQVAFIHSGDTAGSAAYIKLQRERASGTAVVAGDVLGQWLWQGHDGTQQSNAASIVTYAEGTISSGVVPGQIRFSTANSAGAMTERMRIDSSGNVNIGSTPVAGRRFVVGGNLTGAASGYIMLNGTTIQPDVTGNVFGIATNIATGANGGTPWTLTNLYHYNAAQATFHADSTVTNQIGYQASGTLVGATNNYGFFGNIPLGTGRWNFFAAGTARNFMAGRLDVGGTARTDTAAAPSLTNPTNFYSASATYTNGVTAASGTVAHVAVNSFDNPALAASNTDVTYTNASTVYIDGPPTAGTNVTITNPYALYVASGESLFGGGVKSSSATAGIGYATGAGGTVTQATSRTTGVTLNKVSGAITLVSAAGSTSWQSFTVTNSTVAATDTIIVNQKSGTDKNMIHVTAVAAGSFEITFATTGGATTEQPVFSFNVIKGVTA